MSVEVTVVYEDDSQLATLQAAMADKAGIHSRIAGDALTFVRRFGAQKARGEHRTARRLGAGSTGHLSEQYEKIASASSAAEATLLVPRAGRLRAAFGTHTITKSNGYLTLPVHKDAYGRRAREFSDLVALRVGPRKNLILARKTADGELETMYFLTKSVTIKEDATLIPFKEIYDGAGDSVMAFLDEALLETIN